MPKISETRKDERRRQILWAALTCFARVGFHETTIRDICAEAKLSTGAVYNYFDSKDAIIEALSASGLAIGTERVEALRGASGSGDPLRAMLAALEAPGSAVVNQYDLRLWAEAIVEGPLRESYLHSRETLHTALTEFSQPAAKACGVAPEALAELILAVIAGCEVRRAIEPSADLRPLLGALHALLERPA